LLSDLPEMIGPLLRVITSALTMRGLRDAAGEAARKTALIVIAALGGAVALFCFSNAGLTLLERHMGPAEAWGVMGCIYGIAGAAFYLVATVRRRRA
jgi:hypothetical protein